MIAKFWIAKLLVITYLLVACSDTDSNAVKHNTVGQQGLFKNQAIVLDAQALTQVYRRFFAISATDIFTPAEKNSLGKISYDSVDPLLQSGFHLRDTDQAYVKTLRVKLAELCPALVNRELTKVRSDPSFNAQSYHLVFHNDAPSAEHISKSMRIMFNMPASYEILYGAEEYAALFATNLSKADDREQKLSNNYVLLCMAIGQDSRTYLR